MAGAEVLNPLNTLTQVGVVGDLADGALLRRFVTARDGAAQAAFTAMVERHGPMVLGVCRHVLGDSHDAQDAFQATFLVLARKAVSIRKADSAASWLHGVALRVAARAKADAARRRAHERRGAAMKAAERQRGDGRPESWPELHAAVTRLPVRYREPVVLCYLEGLSVEAAAARIGCPRGTVLSRLSRARERLRGQLARRGLAMPAVLPASAIPAVWLEATVRASLSFAGRGAAGAVLASAAATELARGVLYTMTVSKLKVLVAASLTFALALGGARTFAYQFGGSGKSAVAAPDADDRQAALTRSVEKLQAELDESARRSAELRKELQGIQAELKSLRAASRPAVVKEAGARDGVTERMIKPGPGEGKVTVRNTPDGARRPQPYSRYGKFIIATSPEGGRAMIYDTETKKTHSIQLPGSKESPLEVTPVVGPGGIVALWLKGPKITRLAAASTLTGAWYTQDLREPIEGQASPVVGPGVVFYSLGRYVYAFSSEAGRWDVVELPEGITAQPIAGPSAVTFEGGGHIWTFTGKTGKWDDLDLNAVFSDLDPTAPRRER